jgi:hypothetical protein
VQTQAFTLLDRNYIRKVRIPQAQRRRDIIASVQERAYPSWKKKAMPTLVNRK